jgi:hypothetical protein
MLYPKSYISSNSGASLNSSGTSDWLSPSPTARKLTIKLPVPSSRKWFSKPQRIKINRRLRLLAEGYTIEPGRLIGSRYC